MGAHATSVVIQFSTSFETYTVALLIGDYYLFIKFSTSFETYSVALLIGQLQLRRELQLTSSITKNQWS